MTQKGTDNEKGAESSLETKPNNQKTQNSLVIVTTVDICPTTVPRIQLISKNQPEMNKGVLSPWEAVWYPAV